MRNVLKIACLVALLASPAAAAALEASSPPSTPASQAPLSAEEMSSVHAGADSKVTVLTTQQLTGTTSGNSITAGTVTSGAIGFSPDAQRGFSGVGNFVVNTGANNTLQGSINISIVTAPHL